MPDDKTPRKFDCTECNRPTSHDILHTEEVSEYSEESGEHWGASYHIVRCRGCGATSFAEVSWNSEEIDFEASRCLRPTCTRAVAFVSRSRVSIIFPKKSA